MLVTEATPEEICRFFGIEAWVGIKDDRVVGIAGFRRDGDRVWGFLDLSGKPPPLTMIKAIKRRLDETDEPVYVGCAEHLFPSAPKLLTLLGFAPTEETVQGMRVWAWHR